MNFDLNKYTFVIPARRNSKGLPFKNRKLLDFTLESLPEEIMENVVIATDDELIKERHSTFNIFDRSEEVSNDRASTKSLMLEISSHIRTDNIIMLYLTYPERTYENIVEAIKFYESNYARSLLCRKEISTSPFLMLYDMGIHGEQIVKHNYYRRQDYPKCFEISHFVSIFDKKELIYLNDNLYNEKTVFMPIDNFIDVDTHKDLEKFNENKNNC